MKTVPAEMEIVKAYDDEVGDDGTIYSCDEYYVTEVYGTRRRLFMGSYTQCLTFVGALFMGKAEKTAVNFARGVYR